MRVSADVEELRLAPGDEGSVTLDIVNTGTVIDGVRARAVGLPTQAVRTEPAVLSLFPEARGSLSVRVGVPHDFPAGRHPVVLEVVSSALPTPRHVNLDLVVAPRPELAVVAHPPVIRGRRRGRFLVEVANRGNLPLAVSLRVSDAESALICLPEPATLVVPAGSVATSLLRVKAPRRLAGGELDRPLRLVATGTDQLPAEADQPVGAPVSAALPVQRTAPEPAPASPVPPVPLVPPIPLVPQQGEHLVEDSVPLVFRQRALLSRGLLTALVLLSIIALWAAAFLLGITKVLGGDPMTKTPAASFFASTPTAAQGAGGAGGTSAGTGTAPGAAPAGAAPKNGLLPAGVGGLLSGRVVAASDGSPVGRIVVQAYRRGPSGIMRVASAATQADGTYAVAGLFPGNYLLQFSAAGFRTVWYPAAPSADAATPVSATAGGSTAVPAVTVTGLPASLSGTVDFGNTLEPPTATVAVTSLAADGKTGRVARTSTAAGGAYALPSLPAPGKYQVAVSAPGYQVSTFTVSVNGGQKRFAPTVLLSAGAGSIAGQVTDGTDPLGGVSVTTTMGTSTLAVATPTEGAIGRFTLGNLQTPATYVLTFSKEGYGSATTVVDLGPGENRTSLSVALVAGTGTVTGTVLGPDGGGVGGATVTVGGAPTPVTTTTVTTGAVGFFAVSGLPVPGTYTLTVTKKGLAPQTVPVTLDGTSKPPTVSVTLGAALGSLAGTVSVPRGVSAGGITITVTSGLAPVTTQTDGSGRFVVAGLSPGTYAVTASGTGLTQQTAQVAVSAGEQQTASLALEKR
ncbi:MAG TPA: carboxypeptidase-like regulatory domain-containing protein [Motilibacteraceae bacterium]|nr:carboxypeptidase-like regulatory domain-containing protein [Motilibacteraceae bacterium]